MTGVTPTGYETRSLSDIRTDLNAALVAAFGAGFDTSLSTPQGQLVAVFADALSTMHEQLQLVYSSFSYHEATGTRLDQLGALQYKPRTVGESDEKYRARLLSPSNPTIAAVELLASAVSQVAGVTAINVQYNASGLTSESGAQALTAQIIVDGGDDTDVAQAIYDNLVFGLGLTGNTHACINQRTIRFVRAELVPITVSVVTSTTLSNSACGGASVESVKTLLQQAFTTGYAEVGVTIVEDFLRSTLVANGIGVGSLSIDGASGGTLQLTQWQRGTLAADDINVVVGA